MSPSTLPSVTKWAHLPRLGSYQFYDTPARWDTVTGERLALTCPGR